MRLPEDKFISANGLTLHYLDWGNPEVAPALLLHGITASAHHWDFFASSLEADYHVLALDLRGHGDSDRASSYTPEDYTRDLESFASTLDLQNMLLIGHSLGGIISTIYAARNPERVSRLVIVDIGPELAAAGVERLRNTWSGEPESFQSREEAIQYMRQNDPLLSDAVVWHLANHAFKQEVTGQLIIKYDKAVLSGEIRSPEWLWDYLKEVVCPTLLVHGMQSDLFTAELSRRMAQTLAFGSVVDIEHAGHNVIGDNPEAFAAGVGEFLRTVN